MRLVNFVPAFLFLNRKFLKQYFTTKIIIKAFVSAFLISNFIFLAIFDYEILNFISPFLTILGIYLLINTDRIGFFLTGFFVGILWFYWIGFSFIYYDMSYMIPIVIIFVGIVYGVVFFIASFPSFVFLRAVMVFLISYIHPFGFNWFNLEATLVLGVFEPSTKGLIYIFLSAYCLRFNKFYKLLFLIPLIFAIQIDTKKPNFLPFDVELIQTNIPQDKKWDKRYKNDFINENLKLINSAIKDNKKLIIMPENAFATFMNFEKELILELKKLSKDITIVAGALSYENRQTHNSTYIFDDGKMQKIDKYVLVPFGEEIPLPNFMRDFINKNFFNGASDFRPANDVGDYEIDGVWVRNAICYEATTDKIYKNNPKIIIAITNNGWFKTKNINSTEPVLQHLLLKYYATKYGTTIYHSVNGSKSEIIVPKKGI
ncbi:apolipoprotein N-acyltransferase [Campylobacter pinnipediorum subsp. pinnipediorum]|uniref:apolipoprotein N-acyltransferase n=1 Tax=Campylobacter pinnipediorum TaxID=1965231 RepID=UPI00099511A4|nr:apolipoprotein N-acyltransferase [Campylobacter pinnipediorum]AQW82038.1 apolipoprotein N-acyltransferase [Campylobacter pinnipediorum subsp. pinnipediorum]